MSIRDAELLITCPCGWSIECSRRSPWGPSTLFNQYEWHWKLAHGVPMPAEVPR